MSSTQCYDSIPTAPRKPVEIAADLVRIGDDNHSLHAEAAKCLMALEADRDSWRRVAERLEASKTPKCAKCKGSGQEMWRPGDYKDCSACDGKGH